MLWQCLYLATCSQTDVWSSRPWTWLRSGRLCAPRYTHASNKHILARQEAASCRKRFVCNRQNMALWAWMPSLASAWPSRTAPRRCRMCCRVRQAHQRRDFLFRRPRNTTMLQCFGHWNPPHQRRAWIVQVRRNFTWICCIVWAVECCKTFLSKNVFFHAICCY